MLPLALFALGEVEPRREHSDLRRVPGSRPPSGAWLAEGAASIANNAAQANARYGSIAGDRFSYFRPLADVGRSLPKHSFNEKARRLS